MVPPLLLLRCRIKIFIKELKLPCHHIFLIIIEPDIAIGEKGGNMVPLLLFLRYQDIYKGIKAALPPHLFDYY